MFIFEKLLQETPLADYPRCSRVHRLNTFDFPGVRSFVKREDELGFGISGSKIRKYLSLLPFLLKEAPQEVVLVGSPFSNHILGMAQLLIENGLTPLFFFRGDPPKEICGNFFFTSLMADPKKIHWFKRGEDLEERASAYAKKRAEEGVKVIALPEGGSCKEALPGLLTLPLDLLRNEQELGVQFDHLFIDAGTGMTASLLLLALAWMQKKIIAHILLIAGTPEEFYKRVECDREALEDLLGQPLPSPPLFILHLPKNASSFGSVNSSVKRSIREIAQTEGIFTDPLYTAKLFQEGKDILKKGEIQGNVLFIHSGGALSLTGFFPL